MIVKAIVLDMDGTLVNTETLWKEAERAILASYGRTYDAVTHAQFLGLAVQDFIPAVQQAYDLEHIETSILEQDLEERVRNLLATQTQPTVGATDLITYIYNNNIPCAIASNSSHAMIQSTLHNQRWADVIDKRYSADDVPNAKPAPDLYQHAAEQLGMRPQDCIAVEDSLAGVKAAVAAGMTCLAVPDHELSDLSSFQSVTPHVHSSLYDVLKFIQANI